MTQSLPAGQKTTPRWWLQKEHTLLLALRVRVGVTSQSTVSLNKGLDLSLFREIMHKHQGELRLHMYRWGHFCTCTVRKHGYTYTCSKMVGNLLQGDFSNILRVQWEKLMERSAEGPPGHFGQCRAAWVRSAPWSCKSSRACLWKDSSSIRRCQRWGRYGRKFNQLSLRPSVKLLASYRVWLHKFPND